MVFSLWHNIVNFTKEHFTKQQLIYTYVIIGIAIYLNYAQYFSVFLELNYQNPLIHSLVKSLFQAVPFFAVLFAIFGRNAPVIKQGRFWLFLASAFTIVFLSQIPINIIPNEPTNYFIAFYCFQKCIFWVLSYFSILIPAIVLLRAFKKEQMLAGLSWQNKHIKSYTPLILAVFLISFIASFLPHIQDYYPRWLNSFCIEAAQDLKINNAATIGFFELCYSSYYFNVELLYRGVFVIMLSHYLGPKAILPMVAAYTALHFGKPLAECITSSIGGYILGVLAYQTRNIWGGIVVHVVLALSMEIFASLVHIILGTS